MRYVLKSNSFVHAPGLVAWAINGYHFKEDRPALMRIMQAWSVPESVLEALLLQQLPYEVEGEDVIFEVE